MVLRMPGVPDGRHRIRTIVGVPVTEWGESTVEVTAEVGTLAPGHILQLAIHRHGRAAAVPVAAVLSGWGDWTGAVATTVSHDTHNLIVFGVDPVDMAAAANAVIAAGGGVAVATGGEVVALIELPIAGILSPLPAAEVAEAQRRTQDAALDIGLLAGAMTQPLLQCFVSSLACLGGPHVTDVGLVDGTTGELVASMLVG
jgi:adenine deaminase